MLNAPRHIGIVGCSAEGAALCYRTIVEEGAALFGAHAHPEITMHTPSLARYVEALDRGDRPAVAALMLDSAHRLAAAGAQFLVCPDNTIHDAWDLVQAATPLPWLHIAEEVAKEAVRRGHRKLGVLGTHWLVRSEVYPAMLRRHGIEAVRPDDATRDALGAIIMDELVQGVFDPASTARFQAAIDAFRAQGCDAVVLGCTEIPLVVSDANASLPTLDSTRLLARAALRHAAGA